MAAAFRKYVAQDVDEEDDDEDEDAENECDEDDFDDWEWENDIAPISMKRISCFAHSFQLVAKKFNNYVGFRDLLKGACQLNTKVNSSTNATEHLMGLCRKNFAQGLSHEMELNFSDLAASEMRSPSIIQSLLQPFADFTTLVSGEKFTTISSVILTIMELNLHLDKVGIMTNM